VSRERAKRRAERLVVAEKEKAARARRSARRQSRRALVSSLKPGRRSSPGRLYRRSRAQRTGIVVVPLLAASAVWFLVPELALRLVLIAMIVLVLPALVVVVLGRRS
jgi:Flp pilus assembly protein TadB